MKKKLIYLFFLNLCFFIYITYLNVSCGYDCRVLGTEIPVIMFDLISLTIGSTLLFILIFIYLCEKYKKVFKK
jgi:hypothetical protein